MTAGTLIGVSLPLFFLMPLFDALLLLRPFDASAPLKALPKANMKELSRQVPAKSSWGEVEAAWGESNLEDSDSEPAVRPYFPGMSLP